MGIIPSHSLAVVRNEARREGKAEVRRFWEGGLGPREYSLAMGTQTLAGGAGGSSRKSEQNPKATPVLDFKMPRRRVGGSLRKLLLCKNPSF